MARIVYSCLSEGRKTRTSPDYVGIAWKWLSENLAGLITDQWYPRVADDSGVIVSGSLVDKTGESRTFSVFITREGAVKVEKSYVTPKLLTAR